MSYKQIIEDLEQAVRAANENAIRRNADALADRRSLRRQMLLASRSGATFDALAALTGFHRSTCASEIKIARDEWDGDPMIAESLRPGRRSL